MLRTSRFSFCDGYERCFCVCVCVPSWTHSCQAQRFHPTLSPDFKTTRAAHQAAAEHHHRTSDRLIYMGALVLPLCNLRKPRDLKSTTPGRGTLYYYVSKGHFLHMGIFCSSARGSFLGCGARRRPAWTPRCKCGPWPRSAARALGVRSWENWQITIWSVSDHLEPGRCHAKSVRRFFQHELWWSVFATPHEESTQHTARTKQ